MSDDEIDQSTAPLMEHLAELRTRLINSLIAFCVAMLKDVLTKSGQLESLAATRPWSQFT